MPVDNLDHLQLPIVTDTFTRKKRPGFGYKQIERDKKEFFEIETRELEQIKKTFERKKKIYDQYLEPELIFKINLNQSVSSDEVIRRDIGRTKVKILKSSSDKKDYWVAFTEDKDFKKFKEKLVDYTYNDKKNFFSVIEKIGTIPPGDKIGQLLKRKPFRKEEIAFLDVEIWRMDDDKIENFLYGLKKLVKSKAGMITDQLTTKNFCLLRVYSNYQLYEYILGLPEIAQVDRPAEIQINEAIDVDLEKFEPIESPPKGAHGVLIVDSGVRHHPLLENALGHEFYLPTSDGKITSPYDDVGHGTQVAGIALYGNVLECIMNNSFSPEIWIHSAKVLYKGNEVGVAIGDPKKLLHSQMRGAVLGIIERNSKCKVINLSINDPDHALYEGQTQFKLASLLDELSRDHDIIIVVSTGNFERETYRNYPKYLMDGSHDVKILDPASSALSLTVGSVFNMSTSEERSLPDFPSHFTRVGPGYRGMIKPDLVEIGGGLVKADETGISAGDYIVTLNPEWVGQGNLFSKDRGTSYSAPRVSNQAARIYNKYAMSSNMVKAILLSSASIPSERPGGLATITSNSCESDQMILHNIYGYGKPDLRKSLFSDKNRVLLIAEDSVKVGEVRLFKINLPESFVNEKGRRQISISLAFNPPVNRNRASYLGAVLEMHLFKNMSSDKVKEVFAEIASDLEAQEEVIPGKIRNFEIKLKPGPEIRKKSVHQKATIEYSRKPEIDTKESLTLVIFCRNRGWLDKDYMQDYAVVVTVEHTAEIDLYHDIQVRNVQRARIR